MSERSLEVKSTARLSILFDDEETAKIVFGAVQPDNLPLPPGISIDMEVVGSQISVQIESERPILSLLATIDDLLSMMKLAASVLERTQKMG